MCGLAGVVNQNSQPVSGLGEKLLTMQSLISHRGPDGKGTWVEKSEQLGFVHTRLAIIDTSDGGTQPMHGNDGSTLVFNGEIYNYREIRSSLEMKGRKFRSSSDTETILGAYEEYGLDFPSKLRGMFAVGIWDPKSKELILARDRFGIKPLYYSVVGNDFFFASEAKALLPFLPKISTDEDALSEYLVLQNLLGDKTLFGGISQVMPGEIVRVAGKNILKTKYWDVSYDIDYGMTEASAETQLQQVFEESMNLHLRSDVDVGSYLSGGVDSSLVTRFGSKGLGYPMQAFHGRYLDYEGYDESNFAKLASTDSNVELNIHDFDSSRAIEDLRTIAYHMDYPVAGPGSLPQFQIAREAAKKVKVILGGQGGDEIFGGYARYLIGYLEQCLRAAIEGTQKNGNFIVSLESMIPNLGLLREYKPLLQKFWTDGLFGEMDSRYFQLVNKVSDLGNSVKWEAVNIDKTRESFLGVFNSNRSISKEAYFDSMTHYDFKTLLPALLQVEDRVSMAHGLESRVPFLDHKIVEFAATIPANIKFKNGELKRLIKRTFSKSLPEGITARRDKMGFPVPLSEWSQGPLRNEMTGLLENLRDRQLYFLNGETISHQLGKTGRFSRGIWALINLELWLQQFQDQEKKFAAMPGGYLAGKR